MLFINDLLEISLGLYKILALQKRRKKSVVSHRWAKCNLTVCVKLLCSLWARIDFSNYPSILRALVCGLFLLSQLPFLLVFLEPQLWNINNLPPSSKWRCLNTAVYVHNHHMFLRIVPCVNSIVPLKKMSERYFEREHHSHILIYYFISSVQFNHSVVSDSLRHHESQHSKPPCPSPGTCCCCCC